jgi:hypothetical protein
VTARHAAPRVPNHQARSRFWATVYVCMILIGMLWMAAEGAMPQSTTETVVGAAIRQDGQQWVPIVNTAHVNTAVDEAHTEPDGDIYVDLSGPAGPVATALVGVDESLPGRPINCGASASSGHLLIRCWDTATGEFIPGDSPRLGGPYLNLWLEVRRQVPA